MTNFIGEHKIKRIEEYIPTKYNDIVEGNIIYFKYNKSVHNSNPHVLVVNKQWNHKLHGLVIDYMSLLELHKLRDFIISEAEEVEPNTKDTLAASIYELNRSSQTPLTFYDTRLKPYLKQYFKDRSIYRTYEITEIGNLQLVKYNFGKLI